MFTKGFGASEPILDGPSVYRKIADRCESSGLGLSAEDSARILRVAADTIEQLKLLTDSLQRSSEMNHEAFRAMEHAMHVAGKAGDFKKKMTASGGGRAAARGKKSEADRRRMFAIDRFKQLIATGDRDANEAMRMMVGEGYGSLPTLYRYLSDELLKLGRGAGRKNPVKPSSRRKKS